MIINSNNFNISDYLNPEKQSIQLLIKTSTKVRLMIILQQTKIRNTNRFDKLCLLYIKSKLTQIVKYNKNITIIIDKLIEIYANLWGSYNQLSQSESIYVVILIYKHIHKTCKIYLYRKNYFVDIF